KLRSRDDPFLLTDLARASWLEDPRFAAEVARRSKKDGSSCGWLALVLDCDTKSDPVIVRVQSIAVEGLSRRLLGRLPYGRELTLNDKGATVIFKAGKQSRLKVVEDAVNHAAGRSSGRVCRRAPAEGRPLPHSRPRERSPAGSQDGGQGPGREGV